MSRLFRATRGSLRRPTGLTFTFSGGSNRDMRRWSQAVSALPALARNENLRRVELAWGASIAAEWTHFVALGVFAYNAGGASAVGIAGLVRMLPAAFVAPFAATLGDRFRRERFLVVVSLAGAAALGGSAAAYFFSRSELIIFALAGVVGVTSTLFRPALQATLPSLARTPQELIAANGATSTLESLGTLLGPLVAGVLVSVANAGVVFVVASGALLVGADNPALGRVDHGAVVHPRLPERPDRRRRLPAARGGRRRRRLPDGRRWGRRPDRGLWRTLAQRE